MVQYEFLAARICIDPIGFPVCGFPDEIARILTATQAAATSAMRTKNGATGSS